MDFILKVISSTLDLLFAVVFNMANFIVVLVAFFAFASGFLAIEEGIGKWKKSEEAVVGQLLVVTGVCTILFAILFASVVLPFLE